MFTAAVARKKMFQEAVLLAQMFIYSIFLATQGAGAQCGGDVMTVY